MTVRGVANTSPIGPQSQAQKVADSTTATGDRPVECPKKIGSITWPVRASRTKNKAKVQSTIDQPGSTDRARTTGKTRPRIEPMYGINRSTPASTPHRKGLGTPP